jgi:hypothetical protein
MSFELFLWILPTPQLNEVFCDFLVKQDLDPKLGFFIRSYITSILPSVHFSFRFLEQMFVNSSPLLGQPRLHQACQLIVELPDFAKPRRLLHFRLLYREIGGIISFFVIKTCFVPGRLDCCAPCCFLICSKQSQNGIHDSWQCTVSLFILLAGLTTAEGSTSNTWTRWEVWGG